MDLQTGKLYWMKGIGFWGEQYLPPVLIVITDISEERDIIIYYCIIGRGTFSTSLRGFKADYTLSPT